MSTEQTVAAAQAASSASLLARAASPTSALLSSAEQGVVGSAEASPRHAYQYGSGDNERLLSGSDGDSAGQVAQAVKAAGGDSSADLDEITLAEAQYRKKERLTILRVVVVLLVVGVIVIGLVYAVSPRDRPLPPADPNECVLSCTGPVLQVVQFSGLFNDSKTFVDMPMLFDPADIVKDFNTLPDYSQATIVKFLDRNFAPVCTDMLLWSPPDYREHPKFAKNITDVKLRDWALDVHSLWNLLGRQMDPDVALHPRQHTLLPLRSPHMIVPGGRFCEFYYWDTYWIIRGLLVSGMVDTARMVVDNLLGLVEDYGFIPNGSRRYYLNRSQPPMLTKMVRAVFDVTGDKEWLRSVMPTLELEYAYWMHPNRVVVIEAGPNSFRMNKYYTNWTHPRPESFVQDEMTAWMLWKQLHNGSEVAYTPEAAAHHAKNFATMHAQNLAAQDLRGAAEQLRFTAGAAAGADLRAPLPNPPHPMHDNAPRIQELYAQLAAAAETGWDFSSRWFEDRNNLTSVETMDLVPVDLNAIMYAVELDLSSFALTLGDQDRSAEFSVSATLRREAIYNVLWNATASQWQDYHIDQKEWRTEVVLSNFIPLWTKCYDTALVDEGAVVSALLQSGLVMPGGVATTLNNNTQQWDFPNAWAPLQWMLIEGLRSANYRTDSTTADFTLYNSSALAPGEPAPAHACDIVKPETWYKDDLWCFPSGAEISDAMGMRWLLANFVAYNRTGFMLEKYYAPEVGGLGAGGEYELQKGFGWTNGVALELLQRYGAREDFTLERISTIDYPYAKMAPFAVIDYNPFVPPPEKKEGEEEDEQRSR